MLPGDETKRMGLQGRLLCGLPLMWRTIFLPLLDMVHIWGLIIVDWMEYYHSVWLLECLFGRFQSLDV